MTGSSREFALIDVFRRGAGAHSRVPVGIGDDCVVISFPKPADGLFAADMLLEGAHFTIPPATPEQIGWKALAVNLSDLAAMASRPLAAVVSLGLPRRLGGDFAHRLQAGMQALATQYDMAIAGGDTNFWDGPLVVNVAVLGEAAPGGAICRSGAQPGDWILATGSFGGSIHGRHLRFTPRVAEALALAQHASLHAMIDVSDGLSADLYHILDESHVAAVLQSAAIPIHEDALAEQNAATALERALGDGEDFELVFTVSPEDGARLIAEQPLPVPLTHIGIIEEGTGCRLQFSDGRIEPLSRRGWEHH